MGQAFWEFGRVIQKYREIWERGLFRNVKKDWKWRQITWEGLFWRQGPPGVNGF